MDNTLYEMLKQGFQAGTDRAKAQNEATARGQLAQLLQQQKAQQAKDLQESGETLKSKLGQDKAERDAAHLQDMIDKGLIPEGAGAKFGDASFTRPAADPTIAANRLATNLEAKARTNALNLYDKNPQSKDIADRAAGNAKALSALIRNDATSKGMLIQGIMEAGGFKRFNTGENDFIVPPQARAEVQSFLGRFGLTLDKDGHFNSDALAQGNSFEPQYRQQMMQHIQDNVADLRESHNTLKGKAVQYYTASTGATPEGADKVGTVGGATEDRFKGIDSLVSKLNDSINPPKPGAAGQVTGANGPPAPPKNMMDRLQAAQMTRTAPVAPPVDMTPKGVGGASVGLKTQTPGTIQPPVTPPTGGMSATAHPDADAARAWAKANPGPQADTILQRLGPEGQ